MLPIGLLNHNLLSFGLGIPHCSPRLSGLGNGESFFSISPVSVRANFITAGPIRNSCIVTSMSCGGLSTDTEVLSLLAELDAAYTRLGDNVRRVEARDAALRARNQRVSAFIEVATMHARQVVAARTSQGVRTKTPGRAAAAAKSARMLPPPPVAVDTTAVPASDDAAASVAASMSMSRKRRTKASAKREVKRVKTPGGAKGKTPRARKAKTPASKTPGSQHRWIARTATHKAINVGRFCAKLPSRYAANASEREAIVAVLRFVHRCGTERTTLPLVAAQIGSTAMKTNKLLTTLTGSGHIVRHFIKGGSKEYAMNAERYLLDPAGVSAHAEAVDMAVEGGVVALESTGVEESPLAVISTVAPVDADAAEDGDAPAAKRGRPARGGTPARGLLAVATRTLRSSARLAAKAR